MKIIKFASILIYLAISINSCSSHLEEDRENSSKTSSELRSDMRNAQSSMRELFYYIWSGNEINSNEKERLKDLVGNLASTFHSVEKVEDKLSNELGFQLILENQILLLSRVKKDLEAENLDFALWQLRGVSHNCFYCHTRLSNLYDLHSQSVVIDSTSFESRLAEAEYLVASRQFTRANDKLLSLAREFSNGEAGAYSSLKAVKLWLLLKLRVRKDFKQASQDLSSLLSEQTNYNSEQIENVKQWISDLNNLADYDQTKNLGSIQDVIKEARKMLSPINDNTSEQQNETNLVKTIFATSILHEVSSKNSSDSSKVNKSKLNKQEILSLLGIAYDRITIPSLNSQSSSYFKHCIEVLPKTKAAKLCYNKLKIKSEIDHTGSSGVNYLKEELDELEKYKKLSGS